ncbi:1783_t:CDS:2, partial [Dentiscutata erythropus]
EVISFLYAIVSHGTADISWHSIGMHSGFITAMSEMNFNQNWGTAHSAADTGGEFTISHMANLDYLEDKWKVPVDDLIEIYKRTNQSVLRKHIDYCVKQAFAAIQANK